MAHVGYAKRTLENWVTFSFPRRLSIFVTFFFLFNTIKKFKKNFKRSTVRRKKKFKRFTVIYIILPSVDLN